LTLQDQLIRDEGMRLFPYVDTVGKTSIGVGRNLSANGISQSEAIMLLANDMGTASRALQNALPWVTALDSVRLAVLQNMCFNIGIGGLCGFKLFLAAVQQMNWAEARNQMLSSVWAEQVGPRAQRLAIQIETGQWQ
jgi:lysozyme